MTPASLERHGTRLYGTDWKRPLCRALGVSERTLHRWAAGSHPIPSGIAGDLERLHRARDHASAAARDTLDSSFYARIYRNDD